MWEKLIGSDPVNPTMDKASTYLVHKVWSLRCSSVDAGTLKRSNTCDEMGLLVRWEQAGKDIASFFQVLI